LVVILGISQVSVLAAIHLASASHLKGNAAMFFFHCNEKSPTISGKGCSDGINF
jgi:hypothetical protein